MVDPFGNYLCQKLIDVVSEPQVGEILDGISNYIGEICMNNHGTRTIQKLIERIKNNKQFSSLFLNLINQSIPTLVQVLSFFIN